MRWRQRALCLGTWACGNVNVGGTRNEVGKTDCTLGERGLKKVGFLGLANLSPRS